jgi:hypothetical protein
VSGGWWIQVVVDEVEIWARRDVVVIAVVCLVLRR